MSNVEFNLLPQSRATAIATKARQEGLMNKAMTFAVVCLGLFILLFIYADVVQKAQIGSTKKDITAKSAKLQQVPDIQAIVTVQNQLKTAASLNQGKHITSRLFSYLTKLTPTNASINNIVLDLSGNTINIDGGADTANTANAFIDALKSSQYQLDGTEASAFSNVVEESFSIDTKGVSYSLTANFDPTLFAGGQLDSNGKVTQPQLQVPSTVTSRSSTDPASLFGGQR